MKERIIGAVVLVVFVVLVVPVFLDGPPDDGEIVSERVPLPGQSDQKMQTVVLDRDRSEPVPSQPASVSEQAEEKPQPAAARPAESRTQPVEEPAAPRPQQSAAPAESPPPQQQAGQAPLQTASATGMWAVQLGSFSNQQNAEKLAADLRKQGFAAFLSRLDTDGGSLHRVRIGPQKDRESAEAMAERLAKAGHKGQVVPHP